MNVISRAALGTSLVMAAHLSCRVAHAEENRAVVTNESVSASAETSSGNPSDPKRDSAAAEQPREGTRRVDHFRGGVLGSVGFPRPLAIEGFVKIERILGVGVEYSALPSLSVSGVNTHFWAIAADARVFPFKNAFFIGLRAGRQHLGGDATVTVAPYGSLNETLSVDSTFVNPRLGFLWTWEPGISLGVNIGVQVPVSTSSSNSLPSQVAIDSRITRVTNTLGRYALPTLDLLQIGVLL